MKVLLFIESIASGGAERQLVGLANLLKEFNYDVNVVTYYDTNFYARYLEDNNIEYVCVPNATNKFTRIFHIFKYFQKNRPDIVISYLDTPNIISIIIRILGLRYKLIVSERNTTQNLSIRESIKFHLYRYSDKIVPNSSAQMEFILTNFPSLKPKVRLITNFVNTDYFCPSTENKKTKSNLSILVVGRIEKQKNTLRFIEAIFKVKNKGYEIMVDWYGDKFLKDGMPTDATKYYLETLMLVNQLGMETNIKFHDPTINLLSVYQSSDVLCLPSIYEGFPNAICEAMACGKPILAGNIGDNRILVEPEINGFLFDPYSSESMASIIEIFFNLANEHRDKMGMYSREKAIKLFSKNSFIMKYLELIE